MRANYCVRLSQHPRIWGVGKRPTQRTCALDVDMKSRPCNKFMCKPFLAFHPNEWITERGRGCGADT